MGQKFILAILLGSLIISGCQKSGEDQQKSVDIPSVLEISPAPDTLFLSASGSPRSVALRGLYVSTSSVTAKNSGVLVQTDLTFDKIDSSYKDIPSSLATWTSTNPAVASVSQGIITPKTAGMTLINAQIGGVTSNALRVQVHAVNTAPGLLLDPPEHVLTFQNSVTVTGSVQTDAALSAIDPQTGNSFAIPFTSDGKFSTMFTGIPPGITTLSVTAANKNNAALFTTKYKYVAYAAYGSPSADSIVGNWMGTTLGKNFPFAISKSIILTRYDLNGKIDIQFQGLGVVRDVSIIGFIANDGSINASLSKSYEDVSISGSFSGRFLTVGTASGEYWAKAVKTGWPEMSFSEGWTAVKVP